MNAAAAGPRRRGTYRSQHSRQLGEARAPLDRFGDRVQRLCEHRSRQLRGHRADGLGPFGRPPLLAHGIAAELVERTPVVLHRLGRGPEDLDHSGGVQLGSVGIVHNTTDADTS